MGQAKIPSCSREPLLLCIDAGRQWRSLKEFMRIFQDAIEGVLQGLPEQALTILIEKKLAAQGVKLSIRQRKLLTKQIMKGGKDTFRLQAWKWWDHRHLTLEFTPEDVEQIGKKFTEVIENRLPDLI